MERVRSHYRTEENAGEGNHQSKNIQCQESRLPSLQTWSEGTRCSHQLTAALQLCFGLSAESPAEPAKSNQ